MAPLTGQTSYTLPACTFTAPSGKQFAGWNVFGYTQSVGDIVYLSSNMTAQAVWENIPQQDQPITAIVISCSGYVVGGNIAEAVPTTSSTGVTIASYEWQDNNGTKLTSGTFAADTQYRLRVFLNVADGYTANSLEKANVKINGTETTYFTNPCTGVDAQYGDMMIYHYPARLTAPQPTEYMVSYNANGGSGTMVGDMVEENGKFTLENCTYIAPEGYKFKAWAIGSVNGEQKQPGEQITITGETYIYAIWEAVEYNVTVTGGTASVGAGTPITKATMGTTVTLTAGAAPSGQMFDKWVVNGVVVADANSATTTFVMPAGNVTAEATYKNIPVVTYTVSFDANGGTGSMADATGISGEYTLPANGFTAPDGKQFKAWSVDGNEKAVGDKITVTADTTITAVWETIPAGHTCDIKPVAKVEPSCTEGGKEAYYKCEGCGKFYEDALGTKEITDLAAWGNLAKLGHTESDWKSDKDNHWKECTVAGCGVIIENSKAAHADANNDGKCDTCEYNVGKTPTNPGNKPSDDTTKPGDTNKPSDDVQSPQTGDNSMMWLWVALLFVSGFGVVATTVIGKKKSSAK